MLFHLINSNKITNTHKFFINHILLILFFTISYYVTENILVQNNHLHKMTLFDCFHFSLVTQTTVGYGHSYPSNIYSRLINIIQLFSIYGVLVI